MTGLLFVSIYFLVSFSGCCCVLLLLLFWLSGLFYSPLQSSATVFFQMEVDLRWYGTLEYGDFQEFNFLTIQDLRPLNTCQKHFEMILPNFPLDECEI